MHQSGYRTSMQRFADNDRYIPTLIATSCCNVVCICFVLYLGVWMKRENARRNKEKGVNLRAEDIDTDMLTDGENSEHWRYST